MENFSMPHAPPPSCRYVMCHPGVTGKNLCHLLIHIHHPLSFYGGSKAKWEDCRLLFVENASHGERVQESIDPNGIRKFMNRWRYIVKIE